MAERLKTKLLETDKMVDLVAGPGTVALVACNFVATIDFLFLPLSL